MRVITHRALDKFDPTATLGEFIDQEHLMHIAPSGRTFDPSP
jgi:hypothetical protein